MEKVPGASVEFQYSGGGTALIFVQGATLNDVTNSSNAALGGKFVSYTIVSGLQCGRNNL